jgi:hypothetical protein
MKRDQAIYLVLLVLLTFSTSPASADLNILAIGDSQTVGNKSSAIPRPSYRPYLDQSIRNYQALGIDDTDTVSVNWLGSRSNLAAQPPAASAPYTVDSNWVDRHQAIEGISSLRYVTPRDPATQTDQLDLAKSLVSAAAAPGDTNVVLILLGTNDFNMRADSSANGWNGDRFTPTDVIDSIQTIVSEFRALSLDVETMIAAIPPVDQRDAYTSSQAGRFWLESDRTLSSGGNQDLVHWNGTEFVVGPGTDDGGARDASSNEVIDAVNRALMNWANEAANDDVRFVNPFDDPNINDYSLMGPSGSVSIGSGLDLTPGSSGEFNYLTDGVHLNDIGDQYYASAFWEAGLRATLSNTAAAQSVPEPSSFLFLGFVGMLALSSKRYFFKRAA